MWLMLKRKWSFAHRAIAWAGLAFLLITLGSTTAGYGRERGPRVEVVCPAPPIPVTINDRQVLVYELHVTNFDTIPLTLERVDISGNADSSGVNMTLSNEELSADMMRVGEAMVMDSSSHQAKDSRTIEPGARAVIFLWVEMAVRKAAPASLSHRMVFSSLPNGEKPKQTTLENFQVPVSNENVPTLAPPFNGGTWLAGSGPSNKSDHRRAITAIDGHIYSAERFAIDWVKVGPNGDSRHDGATRNENWWGWGEPVLAVADGEITEIVDGIPDNTPRTLPPVTLDNIAGNHVILKIAANRYVTYAHLQNGSIKVRLHDRVQRGTTLALLGNSGNTTGAHLHMQVTDRNSVLEAEGVPFVFASFTYHGPGSEYELDKHPSIPWSNSIPPENAVVEFQPVSK